MMLRLRSRIVVLGWLVAAVIIVALGWHVYENYSASSLQTIIVHPQLFASTISVSGTVTAAQEVDLGFAESGRISGVYAQVGDQVKAGVLLAEVDNGDLRAAVEQKQAALSAQEADLQLLQNGTRPEQIAVNQAQVQGDEAALVQADQSLSDAIQSAYTAADSAVHDTLDLFINNPRSATPSLAFTTSDSQEQNQLQDGRAGIEQELDEWQGALSASATSSTSVGDATSVLSDVSDLLQTANDVLNASVPSNGVSQTTLNTWVADVASARAVINTTSTAVTSAQTGYAAASSALDHDQKDLALQQAGSTQESLDAQEATVQAAQADLENAQAQLDKTIITAPFDGTVTRMDAKVGAVVSPSDPQISLMSNGLFQIDCYVPEVEFEGLATGESATTTLDTYGPSVEFPAAVIAIDPAGTIVDGVPTYKTTLQFLTNDSRVRSGMTANVVIQTAAVPNAFVVPQGAVFEKNNQNYVQLSRDGVASDVAVQEGAQGPLGNVQIVSGLSDGDTVILNPDTSR